MWRVMAASRSARMRTCRGRWAGSPATTRCGWIRGRGGSRGWARAAGRALKRVEQQVRAVPGNGLGFGLLRYLNPQAAPVLARYPAPQIGFNYLGRFTAACLDEGGAGQEPAVWRPVERTLGGSADPD